MRKVGAQVQLNVAIPLDLADELDVFCEKRNVPKKALVELALRRVLRDEDDGVATGAAGAPNGAEGADAATHKLEQRVP